MANSAREMMRIVEEGIADASLMPMIFEQNKFMSKEQFKSQDIDQDGFISYDEFRGPKVDQVFELERNNYIVLSPQFEPYDTISTEESPTDSRDEL